jgi:hypothetical protein
MHCPHHTARLHQRSAPQISVSRPRLSTAHGLDPGADTAVQHCWETRWEPSEKGAPLRAMFTTLSRSVASLAAVTAWCSPLKGSNTRLQVQTARGISSCDRWASLNLQDEEVCLLLFASADLL